MIKHHLQHMAIGAALVLALLLAFGVDLSRALRYALLLACPLGMAAMVVAMGRGRGRGDGPHDGRPRHDHDHDHEHERIR